MIPQKNTNRFRKPAALAAVLTWLGLILFVILEGQGLFGPDIGMSETLRTSGFARIMFADIGAVSTLVAIWIVLSSKLRVRYVFAAASLFVGSFAILPYVALYMLNEEQ